MKICLVSPYSWSFPGGVMEHIDSLAGHLEGRGHEVRVIAPNDPLDLRTRMLHPKLGRHGSLPARVIPAGRSLPLPSNGSLANVAFSPSVFRYARRAFREHRPDVVHVHEPMIPLASWAALKAAKEMGIPLVGTFHANYPEGCAHYKIFQPLLESYMRSFSAKIAVSTTAAATVEQYFPGEYRIIPNGVDVARFSPTGSPRKPGQVLFVGRPDARKGLPVLISALNRVLESVPDARLIVVGSRREYVKLPKRLLSSVEILGPVDEGELVERMRSSSLLCAPSTGGESFGMVLVEAMAAGLPVVASDILGYESVVASGQNGVLVPPGDPVALSSALVSLLLDPTRREELALAGLSAAARYDWSRVAVELEEIYLSLSRRRGGGPGGNGEAKPSPGARNLFREPEIPESSHPAGSNAAAMTGGKGGKGR